MANIIIVQDNLESDLNLANKGGVEVPHLTAFASGTESFLKSVTDTAKKIFEFRSRIINNIRKVDLEEISENLGSIHIAQGSTLQLRLDQTNAEISALINQIGETREKIEHLRRRLDPLVRKLSDAIHNYVKKQIAIAAAFIVLDVAAAAATGNPAGAAATTAGSVSKVAKLKQIITKSVECHKVLKKCEDFFQAKSCRIKVWWQGKVYGGCRKSQSFQHLQKLKFWKKKEGAPQNEVSKLTKAWEFLKGILRKKTDLKGLASNQVRKDAKKRVKTAIKKNFLADVALEKRA